MNKSLLIRILVILLLLLVFGFLWKAPREVIITTDQAIYDLDESPIITIQNNLTDSICFSECYRYYLEKKNEVWESYLYGECAESDLIKRCLEPEKSMGLELIIKDIKPKFGSHRVTVPVCINCQIGEEFKESQRFYSNQFIISE